MTRRELALHWKICSLLLFIYGIFILVSLSLSSQAWSICSWRIQVSGIVNLQVISCLISIQSLFSNVLLWNILIQIYFNFRKHRLGKSDDDVSPSFISRWRRRRMKNGRAKEMPARQLRWTDRPTDETVSAKLPFSCSVWCSHVYEER